jgi:hypothetical protein
MLLLVLLLLLHRKRMLRSIERYSRSKLPFAILVKRRKNSGILLTRHRGMRLALLQSNMMLV